MAFYSWYTSKSQLPLDEFMRIARSLIENGIPKTIEYIK
jgi:hypothetical protein